MLSLLRLERKQNSLNPFRIRIFLFLSYSFGIETINTLIHSRSSLENHTRFQTQFFFQTKNPKRPKLISYPDLTLFYFPLAVGDLGTRLGPNTIPFEVVHTYMAFLRECLTGRNLGEAFSVQYFLAKHQGLGIHTPLRRCTHTLTVSFAVTNN